MPKTKISEFSATAGNNTDIDGINIAEGCPPSGINDAIRELMAQLKDFQAGTAGDSFNGPVGTTTPAAGAFTNFSASGTFALTGDQVQISEGGTGQTTANAAFNALAPSQSTHAGKYLKTDGTNTSWDALDISTADITGTLPIANGGTGLTALGTGVQTALGQNVTGSGGIVLASSPSLTTPNLGTPSAVTLTNATGLPLSTGVTGTLATTNGGTGLTSFTANGVVYASSSSALTTGSALTFSGGVFGVSDASSPRVSVEGSSTASGYLIFKNTTSGLNRGYVGYEFANDAMPFAVNGSEAMRLTSTGLGIGTSSPAYKLDVVGTGSIISATRSDTNRADIIVTNSGGTVSFGINNSTGSWLTNGLGYYGYILGPSSASYGLQFGVGASNTAAVTIDPTGNVGIGTSSPAVKLQVNGSLAVGAGQNISWGGAYGAGIPTIAGSASGLDFYPSGSTAGLSMRLDSSGNLGLGVTPSAGTSGKVFQITNAGHFMASGPTVYIDANAYFDSGWKYITTAAASNYYQNSGAHIWQTAPSDTAGNTISFTQAMTLASDGTLLLGRTTVPSTAGARVVLNSTGDTAVQLTKEGVVATRVMAVSTGLAFGVDLVDGATERARITSGGDLLVGTTSTSPQNFSDGTSKGMCIETGSTILIANQNQVMYANVNTTGGGTAITFLTKGTAVGSISVTGSATAYNTSSDYRLKENQQPLTGSGAFIDALKPKIWNWKTDGSKGVGFIAHEVQEVSPGSVVGTKDAVDEEGKPIMQAMEYGSAEFIANIIAELQSLRARVAQLEAK